MKKINIAGISGSLRSNSLNTHLLQNLQQYMPQDTQLTIISIADIPMYNGDLDIPVVKDRPEAITIFRNQLAEADAVVFVSPEYNYSIPGVLKNAIDWASRGKDSPLLNKPVSLMGVTPGMWGTVRMQSAFLPIFKYLSMTLVTKPEILIAQAKNKFDEKGLLTDEGSIELVKQNLAALRNLAMVKIAAENNL